MTPTMLQARHPHAAAAPDILRLTQEAWEAAGRVVDAARRELAVRPTENSRLALAVARAHEEALHREYDRLTLSCPPPTAS